MELTPVQKLDEVLLHLNTSDKPPKRTSLEIQNELKAKGIVIETKELFEMLYKLQEDKHCYIEMGFGNIAYYWSTFSGQLIGKKGGYEKQEKRKHYREVYDNIQTFVLTVGSVLAGVGTILLFIVEVYKINHNLK